MASLKSNRKLPERPDFASREQILTEPCAANLYAADDTAPHAPDAALRFDTGGNGATAIVADLCPDCGAAIGRPYVVRLPAHIRSTLPLGPNGGVLIARRVPGTDEWLEVEYFPPDDEHDDFRPVDPLLPMKVAAIQLGLTVKTLYHRAPNMASSEKHGAFWFFKRDLLLTVDATGEHRLPSRRDILRERAERRRRGEVMRAGSHRSGCDRRHAGPCAASRRARPSERERNHARRSILDDLGK